ncbi:calcium-transporting ATPase 12, plasma membrane-type-like [Corylus avellana]|uniref:calcium-transporting ATPase 12, plasma membrane-type-like n=1 Tax=Corylus avellana TaxID=13451 RepID=UPI001E20C999|nr:calcium-transporting ATPase 12, plasma membrane-type-like [Corylus avellana]
MSTESSDHDGDLESQQTVLLIAASGNSTPRTRWSRIYLILREQNRKLREDGAAQKDSLGLERSTSSSTSCYSIISTDMTGEADLQSNGSDQEILSASNEVSINIVTTTILDGASNAKLQQENIARMVKEKDRDSLHNFGGIQVIAKALNTDLEKGIHGDEQDLRSRRLTSTLSTTQAPKQGFLQILVTSCNSYIIVLLSVSAVLSIGFGMKEEGRRSGWEDGVVIIVAIIILELAPSLRDFWLQHSQKTSPMSRQKPLESVDVFRGGCPQKVSLGDVLVGDIVCLERETQIPADGLFISGELLELNYDGVESTIDEMNPFLFFGAKVVGGTGRMLVTSVGMDTTWWQLMNQVTQALDRAPLPAKIDRVSTGSQIVGLSILILILVVSFLHFELSKEDAGSNQPDFRGKPTASREIIDAIKRIVIKPNGKTSTLTTSLTMLLVGVTEGIPLVIALAITYWNRKMLSDKASAQQPWACLTMSSVTTICIHSLAFEMLCTGETRKAIQGWANAGVRVIFVSDANVSVLEGIALECGLLPSPNRLVLEVENFQKYSDKERMNEVDKIMAMGSSSPPDRLLLVQCLKKKGHKVAVVGGKINDIPALKEADVGIVIDSSCSCEMARECSDIIIRDGDDFSFLVTIIWCGRCTYDNIQKYIQLELTMNIAGLLITSITTMSFGYSPISAIQLLWANFIVTLLGGLALLSEPLMEENKLPLMRQSGPLITKAMWRNLVSQALYQVAILLTFQFKGQAILGISQKVSQTIIFNSFVLCQVFNQVNSRELEKKNVFRGIHRNPFFWVAVVGILVLQVCFIEIAHILVDDPKLNWLQWSVCLVIGMLSCANDWGTKWAAGCIRGWFTGPFCPNMGGTTSMTPSAPSDSATLELPLMKTT